MIEKQESTFLVYHKEDNSTCIYIEINYSKRTYSLFPKYHYPNKPEFIFLKDVDMVIQRRVFELMIEADNFAKQELGNDKP